MGKITVFSNTSGVVVNSDFWSKVNSMNSEYLTSIAKINIPEKPGSKDLEVPWIFEVFNYCIPDLLSGDLIFLDGELSDNFLYNIILGCYLSTDPTYGRLLAINDSGANDIIKKYINNPIEESRYSNIFVTETIDPDDEYTEVPLNESIFIIGSAISIEGPVRIDNNINPDNRDLQILLGLLYSRRLKVIYTPENSNAFIDFITAS